MGVVRNHMQDLLQRQASPPADQACQRHTMRDQQNRAIRMLERDLVDCTVTRSASSSRFSPPGGGT